MDAQKLDEMYRAVPPWELGRPQRAFQELFDSTPFQGRVLDAGCGTGEHVMELARRGVSVTGVDLSPLAIELARKKARERGLVIDLFVGDVFELPASATRYDIIIDSGLYHVIGAPERYVESLAAVLVPGGRLHVLCYSDREPQGPGPRRVSQDALQASFARGFRLDALREVRCESHNRQDGGAHGWLASFTRQAS
ncbi:class I SAM-dependent methyltransferase [Hyalangium versicolor]|uniref:class I SAM-dependent methyltransferase n=1 Tax=Hyalangium versicolor TaxID=2861190 RepID=UPI001CC93AB6|nr:class I SAM-dependent methyltransferase [Hyalangium versicolor]